MNEAVLKRSPLNGVGVLSLSSVALGVDMAAVVVVPDGSPPPGGGWVPCVEGWAPDWVVPEEVLPALGSGGLVSGVLFVGLEVPDEVPTADDPDGCESVGAFLAGCFPLAAGLGSALTITGVVSGNAADEVCGESVVSGNGVDGCLGVEGLEEEEKDRLQEEAWAQHAERQKKYNSALRGEDLYDADLLPE